MDSGYYDRQAASERKKLEGLLRKRADEDRAIAKAEEAAAKAEAAAGRASSASMAKGKVKEVERRRNEANKARDKAARIARDIAVSQTKVHGYEAKATEARVKEARKATETQQREQRRAERAAREAERREAHDQLARDSLNSSLSRDIDDLKARATTLEDQIAASRREAPETITVLLMAGTTAGAKHALRLDQEAREIDQKIQASQYREQINLEHCHATQVRDVVDALNRYQPDIVHFSGHGDDDSLLFDGPDGVPQELLGDHLALLLQAAPRRIRMVVFNACRSAQQAEDAVSFADVAIGMERPIDDRAAKDLAGQLYRSLADGVPVALAFRQAVAHATAASGSVSAVGDPQLYTRIGIDAEATVLAKGPQDADGAS